MLLMPYCCLFSDIVCEVAVNIVTSCWWYWQQKDVEFTDYYALWFLVLSDIDADDSSAVAGIIWKIRLPIQQPSADTFIFVFSSHWCRVYY